ncbi:MAG: MarR family transcriptional regulator [Myxococcales bacterium]|nr:MarR family transcriptional regulator [Myxococcales bacterium]
MPLDEMQIEALEASLREGVTQLLLETARVLRKEAVQRLEERTGFAGFRASHATLLHHVRPEGTRSGDIATALGISKQAVSQLVSELEAMKVVERVPDPTDGRAKLVRFTEPGRRGALEGLVVMAELEREISAALGEGELSAFRDALARIRSGLSQGSQPR